MPDIVLPAAHIETILLALRGHEASLREFYDDIPESRREAAACRAALQAITEAQRAPTVADGPAWLPVAHDELGPCPWCGTVPEIYDTDELIADEDGDWAGIRCKTCGAFGPSIRTDGREFADCVDDVAAAWNRRTAPSAPVADSGEPVAAWEREFPPEWDRHPWANYACLIVAYGHFNGVTLRWEYFEKEPEWGEKSYNWVDGLHGFVNPVKRAPLSTFFDTRDTLRQRSSAPAP